MGRINQHALLLQQGHYVMCNLDSDHTRLSAISSIFPKTEVQVTCFTSERRLGILPFNHSAVITVC